MKKPKYRNLSIGELEELEKEFIEFLVINGVEAHEWEALKGTDRANEIITAFSDVVFEGIMRKHLFLEHWSPTGIKTFQCLPEKMIMVGADLKSGAEWNLMEASVDALMRRFGELEFYTTDKSYTQAREKEMFKMIENGCSISDGELFKKFLLALTD